MYYIGLCEEEGTYEEALQALDESIAKDRSLSKLQIRDYEKQKKDIYRVIKDEEHYRATVETGRGLFPGRYRGLS